MGRYKTVRNEKKHEKKLLLLESFLQTNGHHHDV